MTTEWDDLKAKLMALNVSVREVETEMAKFAASVFLEHLQQGAWKIENGCLRPADSKAENAMVRVLSDALRLGYHDYFRVQDGKICIYGQVDDGDLNLPVHINHRASLDEIQEECKTIRVNIDLTPLLLSRLERELREAEQAAKRASENVTSLKQAIAKLQV